MPPIEHIIWFYCRARRVLLSYQDYWTSSDFTRFDILNEEIARLSNILATRKGTNIYV